MGKVVPPKISFVVASVDRDQQLQDCVTSIERAHDYKPEIDIEIMIIFQKAKEEKDLQVRYPEIISIYHIDELGLSRARNYAIQRSGGDYLVFLDDDAAVKEDFIDILSRRLAQHSNVNAFCGRLIDDKVQKPFSVLFHREEIKELRRIDYQYFMGSAHILSRQVINEIGCYDERFGVGSGRYGGGEETDIFFRLKVAKEKVLYLPDIVFYHPIIYASSRYVYNYGYAFGAMLAKSCLCDKTYFFVYCYIVLDATARGMVRLVQKMIFKGIYREKDEMYHYGSRIRGIFKGIVCFLRNEFGNISSWESSIAIADTQKQNR